MPYPTPTQDSHEPQYPDLPEWVSEIRPHQIQAVWDILDAFEEVDVVFLDAPTGSGKTLIADMVAREMEAIHADFQTLYVASDNSLINQFANDFAYAKVLKGRANYGVESGDPNKTAADCTAVKWTDPCWHCPSGKVKCPYDIAKREALDAELAVTNTAYLLAEANYVGKFSERDMIVVDEADKLESTLMGFVEYNVPRRYMELVKMAPPIKGARKKTLVGWLEEYIATMTPLANAEMDVKRRNAMGSSVRGAGRMVRELNKDIEMRASDEDTNGMWLREYRDRGDEAESLILKPVKVDGHGVKNLWMHGERWLLMSATIISADEMADSLGLPLKYRVVTVANTFPVENRRIIMAPIADMTYKGMQDGKSIRDLTYAIWTATLKHPTERILIHGVSYNLCREIEKALKYGDFKAQKGRQVITYTQGREREWALKKYIENDGAILISPSMERGIDLPDELCRIQIVAKCPFPALKGTISARTHLPNGNLWYAVQTIRDLVQMTGRGVRHEEDYCLTYIFDAQFARNLWAKWKPIFPTWFQEAVDTRADIREFIRPKGA